MKTENLTWYEALYHVRAGRQVTREGWNEPSKRVYFDVDGDGIPDVLLIEYEKVMMHRNNYGMKLDKNSIIFLENLYLASPDRAPQKAYHPNQEDFIATDWKVI